MAENVTLDEVWRLFRETDRKLGLLAEEQARAQEESARAQKARDEDLRRVSRNIDRVSRNIDRVSQNVNALTGKWGKFVEGLIVPAAARLFAERGIAVDTVAQRTLRQRNGQHMEIDVLVLSQSDAVLVEVKSTLGIDDVNEHLECLATFKAFFPEYGDRRVLGAVAGIEITGNADRYAYRKGLFVIVQSGEAVRIANDDNFKPRVW